MPDITWADVLDVAPELVSGVPPASQAIWVAFAQERVNPSVFGGINSVTYKVARALLAAHFALLEKQGSLGLGATTSRSEGGVSISNALIQNPLDPLLGSTTFGRQYLTLVAVSPARAGLVLGRGGRCNPR